MSADVQKLAIAAGILFAAWKFGPSPVKAGALAIAATIVAKRVPYLNEVA